MDQFEEMIKEYLEETNPDMYIREYPIHDVTVIKQVNQRYDYHVMLDTKVDYGEHGGIQDEVMHDELNNTDLLVWLWGKSE